MTIIRFCDNLLFYFFEEFVRTFAMFFVLNCSVITSKFHPVEILCNRLPRNSIFCTIYRCIRNLFMYELFYLFIYFFIYLYTRTYVYMSVSLSPLTANRIIPCWFCKNIKDTKEVIFTHHSRSRLIQRGFTQMSIFTRNLNQQETQLCNLDVTVLRTNYVPNNSYYVSSCVSIYKHSQNGRKNVLKSRFASLCLPVYVLCG